MAISIIGALFVSNRVLNYIGDYNYGLYSFVNSITAWLAVVSSALTASFLRYTSMEANQTGGDVGRTNTLYLKMLSLIGVAVVIIGFAIIGILYFTGTNVGKYGWEDSKFMYILFALSIFNIGLTMPTSIFSLYINYKKQFIFSRILTIAITVINFIGHFVIAYFFRSIVGIAVFTIVITLITWLSNAYFCKKALNISFTNVSLRTNKRLLYSIFVFSGILLFNSIVDQVNSNVDKTLLGIFATPEDITIYQMAQQLIVYLTTMSVSVSGVFAPTTHELVVKNDRTELNALYLKISKIQSIILCCVAFGFLACGKNFIIWWIGEKRIMSYYVAAILMLLNIGPLTLNSSIEIQRAENKHLFRAITYFALAIANVLLSVLFLNLFEPEYAIFACLAGTVITTVCSHWIAMNIYNKRVMGLPIGRYLFTLLQYIIFGAIGCFAVLGCNKLFIERIEYVLLKFIIQGLVFVLVYLLIAAVFNKIYVKSILLKIGNRRKQ
jgi:O-antigen/teichoic acid export membrane protein